MTRSIRCTLAALAATLAAGCAASRSTPDDAGATTAAGAGAAAPAASTASPARGRRSSTVITAAEIADSRASTALNAVELLRPTFLRSTNPRFAIVVFVNGTRRGSVSELRNLRADEVETITRLNASEAQMRYGPDLLSGAIDVVTKPGRG